MSEFNELIKKLHKTLEVHNINIPLEEILNMDFNTEKDVRFYFFNVKAVHLFGNKYDYSNVTYHSSKEKVLIHCNKCGKDFWMSPNSHISGHGCPDCSKERPIKEEGKIDKLIELYPNYDFSGSVYKGYEKSVYFTCPNHGLVHTGYDVLIHGKGCPKCRQNAVTEAQKLRVDIVCPTYVSYFKNEIVNFIKQEIPHLTVIQGEHTILNRKELDIYIPDLKLAFEFDGSFWHSESNGKDMHYHYNKSKTCHDKGIRLCHIYEDDYKDKKEIIQAKIKHLLHTSNATKIMARKCTVHNIDKSTARDFLNKYHIQGYVASTVYLGAYFNDELIAVMTFKETGNIWDLNRLASNYHYICQGVASKLFKYFVKTYNPLYVKSFLDRSWNFLPNHSVYNDMGFRLESELNPDYMYILNGEYKRRHKFNFRKGILHEKYDLPLSMTETEMVKKLHIHRIWNCGLLKYVWKIEESH